MVDFIKRDKDDIYGKPILGFLFKNQKFLMILKIAVLALFLYAIYFGFAHTGKDNNFTWAVFWGIFWALFMVVTLPTLGRVFCGICPHGFMGKYITKFGLKKTMPKWMQNPFIGVFLVVIGWWGIYYMFPGIYRSPLGTATLFTVMTLLSFVIYFLYKDMSYCKYICPIGTLTRAYSKLSFTWLGTYKSACDECKTFDCATACPYNLKPFTFDKRNSMTDCTLCMDCSAACEAVSFKVKKPSFSLFSKFQTSKAEVWAFILILASISITMSFHHGIGRSNAAPDMIWSKTAEFFKGFVNFGPVDAVGLFAFLYALLFTVLAALIGMFIASKILQKDFSKVFYTLGYSYAPLFILGSIAHSLETFFIKGYEKTVEGFAQGFGFSLDVASLASRGDGWLHIFGLLKWVAIVWALIILYKRIKLIDATKVRKVIAYPFSASLVIFFFSVNMYVGYIFSTYGAASGGHGNHGGSAKVFQSVSKDKITILQSSRTKEACSSCGMNLANLYKANHAATQDGVLKQFCSIHCLANEMGVKKNHLNEIQVVDLKSLKFIDAKKAFYVLGSRPKGVMTKSSKFAFSSQTDAEEFIQKYGGKIVSFDVAYKNALADFRKRPASSNKKPTATNSIYFSETNPSSKRGNPYGGHSHGGGRNWVPSQKVWPIFEDENKEKNCISSIDAELYLLDANLETTKLAPSKEDGCKSVSYKMPDNGYYNLFYLDKTVQDNTLYIKTAKFENMRFNHSNDAIYDEEKMSAHSIKEVPFDILRLREDGETFYHRLYSGDKIRLKVLLNSEPIEGVTLTLSTMTGWSKTLKSDKDGLVVFTLIKDYFPEWNKFDRRHKSKFVLFANYKEDANSIYEDKGYKSINYETTYSSLYYPEVSGYTSYAYGLAAATLAAILSGFIIYFFRRGRKKPFKEVRFDEKD